MGAFFVCSPGAPANSCPKDGTLVFSDGLQGRTRVVQPCRPRRAGSAGLPTAAKDDAGDFFSFLFKIFNY